MALEGNYLPIGEPKHSANGTGTVIKNGYRSWVPCIDDKLDVKHWKESLPYSRLETEKEIILGPDTKLKQLGVDSVQITTGIEGHGVGTKTLAFKKDGCHIATLDFKDKAGMRKVIGMLQDIKDSRMKFSIDQLAYMFRKIR